jgi:alginate O-acetylation protein
MNKILAWFITFNFINITWVFFRAKDWDDALKVLKGMFGLSGGIVLNARLEKRVGFLKEYGVSFDKWDINLQVDGTNTLIYFMVFSFVLVLFCKNSAQKIQYFKLCWQNLTIAVFCFVLAILNMYKMSQFLYFNF